MFFHINLLLSKRKGCFLNDKKMTPQHKPPYPMLLHQKSTFILRGLLRKHTPCYKAIFKTYSGYLRLLPYFCENTVITIIQQG